MKLIRISAIWCTSCLVTNKDWNKIKKEYPEIEYEEYDYDMDEDIVKQYDITKVIPVTLFIKEGIEVARITGEFKKKDIEEKLKEIGD